MGKGGARRNAGRKPNWLREQCEKAFKERKLIQLLIDGASGEPVERHVLIDGRTIMVPCNYKDRKDTIELLKEWGFGKTPVSFEALDDAPRMVFVFPGSEEKTE